MTEDILAYIDIERTIAELGVDPRELKSYSTKKVFSVCSICEERRINIFGNAIRRKTCFHCSQILKIKNIAKNHKGVSLTKEHKEKISISNKGKIKSEEHIRKLNINKKGRKLTEAHKEALRVPKKTSNRLSSAHKKKLSEQKRGDLNPNFGKTPTHAKKVWYKRKNGNLICLRSTWEAAFAAYLDENNKQWEYEVKTFEINLYDEPVVRKGTYTPDFLVDGYQWYEIKGRWTYEGYIKFHHFEHQYPNEKMILLREAQLLALGLDIK